MQTIVRIAASRLIVALLAAAAWMPTALAAADDPLPSWNDGPNKQAIVEFVRVTTTEDSPQFVPVEERIATFDNDGTLWVEQPLYTQVVFAAQRVKALEPSHPQWRTTEPFRSLLDKGEAALADFSIQDFATIVAETHRGLSVKSFHSEVRAWLKTARHPRFKRPYTELIYQPMLELMQYLRANGYRTYIVTGGGQEFVRAFAQKVYGVPPEQVVGSAAGTRFKYAKDGRPELVKLPKALLIDDGPGKPEGINLMIGRRPVAVFGNSTGDRQMLEWTAAREGARLMMLVHHDDGEREYDYGPDSKVGPFPNSLMDEARRDGWHVISMKRDWRRIFAFEQ